MGHKILRLARRKTKTFFIFFLQIYKGKKLDRVKMPAKGRLSSQSAVEAATPVAAAKRATSRSRKVRAEKAQSISENSNNNAGRKRSCSKPRSKSRCSKPRSKSRCSKPRSKSRCGRSRSKSKPKTCVKAHCVKSYSRSSSRGCKHRVSGHKVRAHSRSLPSKKKC